MKTLAPIALIAVLAAPALAQAEPAAPGPALTAKLQGALVKLLRDPMSAQVMVTKGPWRDEATIYGAVQRGEFVCAMVNATNAAGGYVGFKPYMFVLRDDGRVSVMQRNGLLPESDAVAETKCGPAAAI